VRVELMRGQRMYNLSVRNAGERRAFVRVVALPMGESPAALITATPSVCLLAPGASAVMQLRVDGQAPQRLLVLHGDDGTRRRRNRYLAFQAPSSSARRSHDMYADAAYDELDKLRGVAPADERGDLWTTAFERVYDNDLFKHSLRDVVLEFAYTDAAPTSVVPPADLVVNVGPASLGFHSSVLWSYVLPAHAHWRLERSRTARIGACLARRLRACVAACVATRLVPRRRSRAPRAALRTRAVCRISSLHLSQARPACTGCRSSSTGVTTRASSGNCTPPLR
jgi:hypothetical protein